MPPNTRYVEVRITGNATGATRAIKDVEAQASRSASVASDAFDKSTSRIGNSFQAVSRVGANFGLPFTGALALLGTKLDETSSKGKKFGSTLSAIGGAEAIAAGAAIGFIGLSAVHAADSFDTSHARLVQAVTNTGQQFASASGGVSKLDQEFIKLGFSSADTENALSIQTAATHNVATATAAMGTIADIARARNLELAQVSVALTKAAQGNYQSIIRLGIATKDQTKDWHSYGDVLAYVSRIFGGQASAYANTFAGKLAAVKAEANQLQVELGSALIPKLESLASGTIGAVQGFENANRATDGFLGKAVLLGAAIPVGVFAVEKLNTAMTAVQGAVSSAAASMGIGSTASLGLAASDEGLALAQARTALSSSQLALAQAQLPVLQGAAAATAQRLILANEELAAANLRVAEAEGTDVEALAAQTAARREAFAASQANVAAANGVATAEGTIGAAAVAAAPKLSALTDGLLAATVAYLAYQHSQSSRSNPLNLSSIPIINKIPFVGNFGASGNNSKAVNDANAAMAQFVQTGQVTQQTADKLGLSLKDTQNAYTAYAEAALTGGNANKAFIDALSPAGVKAYSDLLLHSADGSGNYDVALQGLLKTLSPLQQAQLEYNLALTAYQNDKAPGAIRSSEQLKTDADKLSAANRVLQGIQSSVNGVIGAGGQAAEAAKFAYLGLSDSVKTVADAMTALQAKAFTPINLQISADQATTSAQSAIDALLHPQATSSGSGETATAAALDAIGKTNTLIQARESSTAATQALTEAETNYQNVLHGVAAGSATAVAAQQAFTQAQDDAKTSTLDLEDAQRNLAAAKEAAANAGRTAQEGLTGSKLGLQSANLDVKDAQDALNQAKFSGDPETVQRAQIALGQAILRRSQAQDALKTSTQQLSEVGKKNSTENENVQRAQIGVTEAQIKAKQSTQDLQTAQQNLNGTLNGFPATSQAAIDATKTYHDAQVAARDAVLGLQRAAADKQGLLSSGANNASKAMASYKTRIDAAADAVVKLAIANELLDSQQGGSPKHALVTELQTLQTYAAQSPDLAKLLAPTIATIVQQILSGFGVSGAVPGSVDNSTRAPQRQRRASGGPVSAGQGYIVGEAGPEFFQPTTSGTIIPNVSLKSSSSTKAGSDLVSGFYVGAKKVYDEKLNPFFVDIKANTTSNLKDSKTWLVQPATDLMAGFYQATQDGYAPTKQFFETGLQADLESGTQNATKAVASGWGSLKKAFQDPTNQAIVHVLNPLVDDVNRIAKAVGMDDILKHIPLVGSFATGGVIPKTGLAKVHEGEGVIPKSAMQLLTQQQFDQIKSGQMLKAIDSAVKSEHPTSGAGRLVDATANKAADDVKKLVSSLKVFVTQTVARGPFGGNVIPLSGPTSYVPSGSGGDVRVPGHTIAEWATDLLSALREPTTGTNVSFMEYWANHESGGYHPGPGTGGLNNPLNTTQPWPNATNGGAQGNIKNYATFWDGIAAQALNLRNPNYGYPQILDALSRSDFRAAANAVDASSFGTKTLGTGGVVHHRKGGVRALLAERGQDELVTPLPRGFDVKNLSRTASAGAGNVTIKIEFNGPVMGADVEKTVHDAMKNLTRKQGFIKGVRVTSDP